MRYRKNKNLSKKILFGKILVSILGFIILVIIIIPVIRNVKKRNDINKEIKGLKDDIARLDGKKNELKKVVDYLSSDQFAIEQARLNLNFKKEGEDVVVIENLDDVSEVNNNFISNDSSNNVNYASDNNIKKWLKYFFKI